MDSKQEEQKETSYRRLVLTTIETLIDIENINDLLELLPNLHGIAWDEVIEERFVNKQCGFPACPRLPPKKKRNQMFQIDRKEGKIYEFCKQRSKFCSEKCYQKSFFIRNQLDEHPLWITGEDEKRMRKRYEIPNDENFVFEGKEEKEKEDVEFVVDSIMAKTVTLKLKEDYEDPKESHDDSEEAEKEPYKLTDDDRDFIKSIREFKNLNFGPKSSNGQEKVQKKKPVVKLSEKDSKKEEEILEKLREKYGNKNAKQKRPPILIDPQQIHPKLKDPVGKKMTWILDLLKSWISDETLKLIKEGPRPSGGAAEQILMDFLSGKNISEITDKLVDLPNLDKYNVKEKRLNIFLHSLRHHWMDLEARLHLTPTRRDLLNRIATTFHLTSDNITGWSKRELNSIVISLFLLICLVDVELGDDFIKKEAASPDLCAVARDLCAMDSSEITGLYAAIKALSC